MVTEFIDLYAELGIAPTADEESIRAVIAEARLVVDAKRIYPDSMLWTQHMDWLLGRAETVLLDPSQRIQYDAERAMMVGAAPGEDDLLWIDPDRPYVFDNEDDDPAYTVPSLAYKLDGSPERGILEITQGGVESMLRNVGYGKPNQARYDQLADHIERARKRLDAAHGKQLLETVIVLCDPTIVPPMPGLGDEPLDGARLPETETRPDKLFTTHLRLSNLGPRGCLFGYIWIVSDWATFEQPAPQSVNIAGATRSAIRFELAPTEHCEVVVRLSAEVLLRLERPATHELLYSAQIQPDTAHEAIQSFSQPIALTKIPPKAVFAPALITIPVVRRGERVRGVTTLVNQGEETCYAQLSRTSNPDVFVARQSITDNDEVEVMIDTSQIRFGSRYERSIMFRANGDHQDVNLMVAGEVLPTAVQHMFRKQSAADRLALATAVGLVLLTISPLMLGSLSTAIFWLLWIVVAVAASAGASALIARRIVEHWQASGDQSISYAAIPLQVIMGAVCAVTLGICLIIAVVPPDDVTKTVLYASLLAVIGASAGFFAKEDIVLFPRQGRDRQQQRSISEKLMPSASRGTRIFVLLCAFALVGLFFVHFVSALMPAFLVVLVAMLVAALFA